MRFVYTFCPAPMILWNYTTRWQDNYLLLAKEDAVFWLQAKKHIQNMHFEKHNGTVVIVTSLRNWVITLTLNEKIQNLCAQSMHDHFNTMLINDMVTRHSMIARKKHKHQK